MLHERRLRPHLRVIASVRPLTRNFITLLRGDLVRHGALVFVSTNLANAFGYLFHFILSRKLGVAGYGELATMLSGSMIAAFPATVFSMTVVKAASEVRHSPGRLRTLALGVFKLSLIYGALAAVAGLALMGTISTYLKLSQPLEVLAVAAFVASMFAMSGVRGILQGTQRFRPFSASIALEAILKVVLGVGLAVTGFGTLGALWGSAFASIVTVVLTLIMIAPLFASSDPEDDLDLGRFARSLGGVSAAMFALTIIGSADVIIVKHFFAPRLAGIYGVVSLAGKMLLFLVGFVPTVVMPKATARALSGKSPTTILVQALVVVLTICGLGLIVYSRLPQLLVSVLAGHAFASAAPYLLLYGVAMSALATTTIVVYYRIGLHRFDFVVPLLVVAVLDLAAMYRFHDSLFQVIIVVCSFDILAMLVSLVGVTASVNMTSHTVRIEKHGGKRARQLWELR